MKTTTHQKTPVTIFQSNGARLSIYHRDLDQLKLILQPWMQEMRGKVEKLVKCESIPRFDLGSQPVKAKLWTWSNVNSESGCRREQLK
jgi:hypothetical protein